MTAGRKRILVVEDDPECLAALLAALDYGGHEAHPAENGREALEWLDACAHPDLVLLDLMLPLVDGWTVFREIRKRPALDAVPVVLLSGEAQLSKIAAELGTSGYLRKPVSLDDLLAKIDQF